MMSIEIIYETFHNHLLIDKLIDEIHKIPVFKTNCDRVKLIYQLVEKYQLFPKLETKKKNNKLAAEFKESGNIHYKKKDFFQALNCYNKAIAFACNYDKYEKELLPIAYGNRSAVLFHLGFFKECIDSIQDAINAGYPKNQIKRLEDRQENAKKFLRKTKKFTFYKEIPEIKEHHEQIKCAANNIKLVYKKKFGRHVVASKNIKPGDIIAIENPYITIVRDDWLHQCCDNCIEYVLNPTPCENCSFMVYCNDKCRKEAFDSYHKYECPLMTSIINLKLKKMARLSLRTTISARNEYQNIKDGKLEPKDPETAGFSTDSNKNMYLDNNYMAIHNLIPNTEHFYLNDLLYKTFVAVVLFNLLEQIGFIEEYELYRDEIMELLLRHLQTAPSNMHSISSSLVGKDVIQREQVEIGSGAYAFASMFNHSCAPNVGRFGYGKKLLLVAIRPIKTGEQLFDIYGNHHAVTVKSQRQRSLKEQYYFDCTCEACINDWPMYFYSLPLQIRDDTIAKIKNELNFIIISFQSGDVKTARKFRKKLIEFVEYIDKFAPCREYLDLQEVFKESYFLECNTIKLI